MTRTPELSSIDCTSCGAGLNVLGGGRVVVHICPYCGAELDALHDFNVLRHFTDMKRPETPFSIGMRGVLFGSEFVIIGILERSEHWAGRVWTWVNHQLYSPTHGYAWLTVENGHLVFSRRIRGPRWISAEEVETAEARPTRESEGATYKYYETTTSTITYAEGEFTWGPRQGEQTQTVSLMSQDAMLSFSQTDREREIYRSVFLPKAEAETAFGVNLDLEPPHRTHPLQPFVPGPNYRFMMVASLIFCAICLMMAAAFSARPGQPVLRDHSLNFTELPAEIDVPLEAGGKLTRISLKGDVHNSWALLDLALRDPEDQQVLQSQQAIERYSGRDSDGNWTQGNGQSQLYFHPEHSGTYKLKVQVSEHGVWSDPSADHTPEQAMSRLEVNITSDLSSPRWLLLLAGLFGILCLSQPARRLLHDRARWSGSDWSDGD